jgi:hypothetical protein
MAKSEDSFAPLLEKLKQFKTKKDVDLSNEEDLSLAIMNLISLEEHFFFTGAKTQQSEYFDFINEVRSLRKTLLARMIDQHEGETWCISKHLLAATMRLMEVGTKYLADKKRSEAEEMFRNAYRVYSLFWALRLKLLKLKDVKKISDHRLNVHDKNDKVQPWTLENIVNKLVDCCDE